MLCFVIINSVHFSSFLSLNLIFLFVSFFPSGWVPHGCLLSLAAVLSNINASHGSGCLQRDGEDRSHHHTICGSGRPGYMHTPIVAQAGLGTCHR